MIEVKNLTKVFDPIVAVNGISFVVKKGEILGFLGPNGAGKSTTMKMLSCFLPPTKGEAIIGGISINNHPVGVRQKIGYMPENAPLYDDMEVGEFLHYIGQLRGIAPTELEQAVNRVVKACSLENVLGQLIETLSKGFKRRVSLAVTLIHDPEILMLDEPTDGLDPNQKHEVRQLIKNMSKDKCIMVSTHILEEVEAVCDRAIIIADGEIKYNGTPSDLKSKSSSGKVDDVFRAITTGQSVEGVRL